MRLQLTPPVFALLGAIVSLAPALEAQIGVVNESLDFWNTGPLTRLELSNPAMSPESWQAVATTHDVMPGADRGLLCGEREFLWLNLDSPTTPSVAATVPAPAVGSGSWLAVGGREFGFVAHSNRGGLWRVRFDSPGILHYEAGPSGWFGTEDLAVTANRLAIAERAGGLLVLAYASSAPRVELRDASLRSDAIALAGQSLWSASAGSLRHFELVGTPLRATTRGAVSLSNIIDLQVADSNGASCVVLRAPPGGSAELVVVDGTQSPPRIVGVSVLLGTGFERIAVRDGLVHAVGSAGLQSVDISDPSRPVVDAWLRGTSLQGVVSAATTHGALTLVDDRGQLCQLEVAGAATGYGAASGAVGQYVPRIRCVGSAGVGSPQFALRCEAGPPSSPVWFLTAHAPQDTAVAGIRVLVDPWSVPGSVVQLTADALGAATLPQPVPLGSFYFGRRYFAQAVCLRAHAGTVELTASHGIHFKTHRR